MIKNLNDAGFSDTTGLKIFHTVFSCEIDGLNFRNWILNLSCLLSVFGLSVLSSLQNVDFVTNENFDGNLTGTFALCDPLIDSFERWSFCNVKEINDGCTPIHILVDIFMMSLLAWHIEIYNFVLVGIIDVEGCL